MHLNNTLGLPIAMTAHDADSHAEALRAEERTKDLPEGYRFLDAGERIELGDKFRWGMDEPWNPVNRIGNPRPFVTEYFSKHYCRRIY